LTVLETFPYISQENAYFEGVFDFKIKGLPYVVAYLLKKGKHAMRNNTINFIKTGCGVMQQAFSLSCESMPCGSSSFWIGRATYSASCTR
jgi:hypothetical protein